MSDHPTDTQRLAHLEEMFLKCPHAEIFFNDDPDIGEPVGWTIRISGCEESIVTAPTFPEAIDLSMAVERQAKEYNDYLTDRADAASY